MGDRNICSCILWFWNAMQLSHYRLFTELSKQCMLLQTCFSFQILLYVFILFINVFMQKLYNYSVRPIVEFPTIYMFNLLIHMYVIGCVVRYFRLLQIFHLFLLIYYGLCMLKMWIPLFNLIFLSLNCVLIIEK